MKTIKIGRVTYDIQTGDYVQYNGACYLFCAEDNRNLKFENWNQYSYLKIPKSRLKEIPFNKMRKVQTESKEAKTLLIKWYF